MGVMESTFNFLGITFKFDAGLKARPGPGLGSTILLMPIAIPRECDCHTSSP
jgi:hypothetical protein